MSATTQIQIAQVTGRLAPQPGGWLNGK